MMPTMTMPSPRLLTRWVWLVLVVCPVMWYLLYDANNHDGLTKAADKEGCPCNLVKVICVCGLYVSADVLIYCNLCQETCVLVILSNISPATSVHAHVWFMTSYALHFALC